MLHPTGGVACLLGRNWGYDANSVWVSRRMLRHICYRKRQACCRIAGGSFERADPSRDKQRNHRSES